MWTRLLLGNRTMFWAFMFLIGCFIALIFNFLTKVPYELYQIRLELAQSNLILMGNDNGEGAQTND